MRILGIETSCDETGIAIVEEGKRIIFNQVASSSDFHKKYGGIVPEIAARKQMEVIIPLVKDALDKAEVRTIDAIAVTVGPGLVGSLLVGVESAKALSWAWDKPVIPVNHLVGHLYAAWLRPKKISDRKAPKFPAIGLVVSGGHTDLVMIKGHGRIKHLGGTRDDAAGEAFDKIARMLRLPYPGGPAIAAEAFNFKKDNYIFANKLPRPMIDSNDYDFSFSGLKTAVFNRIKDNEIGIKNKQFVKYLASEVQEAICEVLVHKTVRAVEKFKPKTLIVSGGVAANLRLRELIKIEFNKLKLKADLYIPSAKLCTDNASYIAGAAFYDRNYVDWRKLKVHPGLEITDKIDYSS